MSGFGSDMIAETKTRHDLHNTPRQEGEANGPVSRAKVVIDEALANHLLVKAIDSAGLPIGSAFTVAKPWLLRHDRSLYEFTKEDGGDLNTVDANQVTASDGTDTYTWTIGPAPYRAGDYLMIEASDEGDHAWIDTNIDARAWGVTE